MVVLASIIFGVSALSAHVLRPAFILAHQNLANNHPFAKFTNFYSRQYFPLYSMQSDKVEVSTEVLKSMIRFIVG